MDALVAWLQSTWLSHAIVMSTWVWPAAETLHFIGLALVIGIIGVLDLRLTGCFPSVPIAAIRDLVPYAVFGFLLNAATGVVFFVGHPEQYVGNIAWWLKVGCLVLAGLNAAVFEWTVAERAMALRPHEPTSLAMRCIGVVSILSWFGVLYWGRMLPFVGSAF